MMHFGKTHAIDRFVPVAGTVGVHATAQRAVGIHAGRAVSDCRVFAGPQPEPTARNFLVDPSVSRWGDCICYFRNVQCVASGAHAISLIAQFVKNKYNLAEIAVVLSRCTPSVDAIFRQNKNLARSRGQLGAEAYVG
jgi:hypothetical protein